MRLHVKQNPDADLVAQFLAERGATKCAKAARTLTGPQIDAAVHGGLPARRQRDADPVHEERTGWVDGYGYIATNGLGEFDPVLHAQRKAKAARKEQRARAAAQLSELRAIDARWR